MVTVGSHAAGSHWLLVVAPVGALSIDASGPGPGPVVIEGPVADEHPATRMTVPSATAPVAFDHNPITVRLPRRASHAIGPL